MRYYSEKNIQEENIAPQLTPLTPQPISSK